MALNHPGQGRTRCLGNVNEYQRLILHRIGYVTKRIVLQGAKRLSASVAPCMGRDDEDSMEIKRVIYMGTAEIAVPVLDALATSPDIDVVAVFSQPDRPAGRKRKLTASPVKARAVELGLPVFTPEKIGKVREEWESLAADLAVVFAYGQYIPKSIFSSPPAGSINVHPSLLPKYRGASPIQSAIANGDQRSGVSILDVSEEMDAGDVLAQEEVPIPEQATSADMSKIYADIGAQLILKVIDELRKDGLQRTPQDPSLVTDTVKLSKEDGKVDWFEPAYQIHSKVRAYTPWPSVFVALPRAGEGAILKIHETRVEDVSGDPGTILDIQGKGGPLVACGEKSLRLLRVQPPGKGVMDGKAFLNGHAWKVGDRI